eukprot:548419-Alexandrium_andersonii.AAC.1
MNKFPDAPWAKAMTLRSVARCIWHNDTGAAHCLIRKSKTAKASLMAESGVAMLKDAQLFDKCFQKRPLG